MERLKTSFGAIRLSLDGNDVPYSVREVRRGQRLFPDVDGAYLLSYPFTPDGAPHVMRCTLENPAAAAEPETGERLEAVAIYLDSGKLTIGCEGDSECGWYDFDVCFLSDGLEIHTRPETRARIFSFGVSWLNVCTDQTDVQTWFGADPTVTEALL